MRDAFGGAFMIKIFLVFIVIYVGFTALSLNYAKAFKVKNKILDYLETNEITSINTLATGSVIKDFENYINEEVVGALNYNMSDQDICAQKGYVADGISTTKENKKIYCSTSGFIIRETGRSTSTKGIYYTVTTYVRWNLPFLNNILTFGGNATDEDVIRGTWKISGETRIIVRE